ncbi:MAG TPA: DsbE family thiol:disulfide interchange protein [Parvularculaceae bacterium]|nr:DsbE family thiol:disulfide interchange protein [Parvularculaceae bacterium]
MKLAAVVPLLLFLGVGAFFALGLHRDPKLIPSTLIDRPLPEFSLPAVDGLDVAGLSSDDAQGEITLINVFGSWCVSCRIEHPVLLKLAQSGAVKIYGVDWRDKPGDGAAWLDALGNPYARVGDDAEGRVAIDLGTTGAPETYVVDQQGRVRYKQVGPITPEVWNKTLKPIVEHLKRSS